MPSKPEQRWTKPPVLELLARLQYRIAAKRKQQLEQQLQVAENALRYYVQKAQRVLHGK